NNVTTANTLQIASGSVVRMLQGTLDLNGGLGIDIGSALFEVRINNDVSVVRNPPMTISSAGIRIGVGGEYRVLRTITTGSGSHFTNLPITNDGGELFIGETVHMAVTGRIGGTGVSIYQNRGLTTIAYGSRLVVPYGFELGNGVFDTRFTGPG